MGGLRERARYIVVVQSRLRRGSDYTRRQISQNALQGMHNRDARTSRLCNACARSPFCDPFEHDYVKWHSW